MTGAPEPKPCKRFAKRFALNDRLLAHVPDCDACRATVLYLVNESDKLMRARRRRVRLRVSSSTTWEFSQDGLCEQQHAVRLKNPTRDQSFGNIARVNSFARIQRADVRAHDVRNKSGYQERGDSSDWRKEPPTSGRRNFRRVSRLSRSAGRLTHEPPKPVESFDKEHRNKQGQYKHGGVRESSVADDRWPGIPREVNRFLPLPDTRIRLAPHSEHFRRPENR